MKPKVVKDFTSAREIAAAPLFDCLHTLLQHSCFCCCCSIAVSLSRQIASDDLDIAFLLLQQITTSMLQMGCRSSVSEH